MSTCVCGNPADSFGGLCDRCVALQTLGLNMNASGEQIENAYRTLVKVWHPDRFSADPKLKVAAEEKLKEINSAHDYLVSGASAQQAQQTPYWRKAVTEHDEEVAERAPQVPFEPDLDQEESPEVRRILRRQKKSPAPRILVKTGFILGAIAGAVLLWFALDAVMSSNQHTSRDWMIMKAQISYELEELHLKPSSAPSSPASKPESAPPSTPVPAQNDVTPPSAMPKAGPEASPKTGQEHAKVSDASKGALPYVTAGLTPMEVLNVLGKPDSSSGEKMVYRGSEIDFRNGHVVGWRIDPKTTSIRVKLWPDAPPTPGLTAFNVGSSKNDVIALQGTPTLFSDNEFGYGNSVIFFHNNRVAGWKEDPASVHLKVAH